MGNSIGWQSFGHGAAAMFGLGNLAWSDPVSDAQNNVAEVKEQINQLFQQSSLAIFKKENQALQDLNKYMQTNNAEISTTMEFYNDVLTNKLKMQNFLITITVILVFILTFFAIIK